MVLVMMRELKQAIDSAGLAFFQLYQKRPKGMPKVEYEAAMTDIRDAVLRLDGVRKALRNADARRRMGQS